jgi:hypothetical protein
MAKNDITTFQINTIAKGLRPTKRAKRDSGFLVECKGAVGRDDVLQVIDQLTRIDTSSLTVSFPYPQLFVFKNITIVCTSTVIYEWVAGALVSKLTVTTGSTWSAVDFDDYVYMTNGVVVVERSPVTQSYALNTTLPKGMSLCNFNGQVFVASPDAGI